jgi:hypothetical protein
MLAPKLLGGEVTDDGCIEIAAEDGIPLHRVPFKFEIGSE